MKNNSVNKRYVPKLRFKGFNEFWKITKIENEFFIKKGVQINKSLIHQNGKFYHLNGGLTYSNKCNKWNTNKNTISISEGGESCGYISWNDQKFWAGGHLYTLDVLNSQNNSKYLYYVLKKNEKLIMNLRVGSSIPNIQKKDLFSFKISISINNEEQIKISNFLSLLDKQISLLENKLKLTEQLKHNYSKNLFANKSNTPKLRFRGFVDEWIRESFSNLVDFARSGGTPKSGEHKYYQNGTIPFLSINDLNQKYLTNCNKKITRLAIDETSTFIFEKNNILLSIYATIGEVAINKIDVALPQSILGIKIKNNINLEYFYYLLLANQKKFVKNSQTGSQPNLSLKIINNIQFQFSTNLKEQTKISNFLLLLDKQIDNVSRKIEIIKNQKKFFLNNLFI